MSPIWIPIIIGIVIIPFISTFTKELDEQEKSENPKIKFMFKEINTQKDIKSLKTFLNGLVIAVMVGIAIFIIVVLRNSGDS